METMQPRITNSYARVYAWIGAGFGLLFPLLATIIRTRQFFLPMDLRSILRVHLTDPLIWIIDTAPLVLSLVFTFAGRRHDELVKANIDLKSREEELIHIQTNLEQRFAERSADLNILRIDSERRAQQMVVISEISRLISKEQELSVLLPLVARLVSERFTFYHVGIFILDETGQYAVLRASNSEGGRRMLDRGHRLEVGESGIVGYVAKYGTPRIALDVGLDAVFFNNPDLPDTRSEIGLPLNARNRILGVLDAQSEKPGAFTEADANTMGILADQIAIAIENARLFQETQKTLIEYQSLYRQNVQEGWDTFAREIPVIGYRFGAGGGGFLSTPVDSNEIHEAVNRGAPKIVQPGPGTKESYMIIPVKLRGQIIGTLQVQAPAENRVWTRDEINLSSAVSDRLSIALENARLIQESQKQALKEQTIRDVTSKVGDSILLQNVLRTAVEELGRALPGSEVILNLRPQDGKGQE